MLSDDEYKSILDAKLENFIKENEVLEMYKDYAWELINQGVFDDIDPDFAFKWMYQNLKFISIDEYNTVDSLTLYCNSLYENDIGCLLFIGKYKVKVKV